MKTLLSALTFVLVAVAVVAGSASALFLGTEDMPELPDEGGDVQTQPGYVGPSDFLDMTASWFEHLEDRDEILITIRVNSTERLGEAPLGFKVGCFVVGAVIRDGTEVGNLTFGWRQHENRSYINHWVLWDEREESAATVGAFYLPYDFALERGTPGYFRFSVPRDELTKLGDEFINPVGGCNGFIDPGGPASAPNNFAGVVLAGDDAASEAAYSFQHLRQSRTAVGEVLDPIERFERENATAPASSLPGETENGRTPGLGFLGVALALSIGVATFMRRSRRGN